MCVRMLGESYTIWLQRIWQNVPVWQFVFRECPLVEPGLGSKDIICSRHEQPGAETWRSAACRSVRSRHRVRKKAGFGVGMSGEVNNLSSSNFFSIVRHTLASSLMVEVTVLAGVQRTLLVQEIMNIACWVHQICSRH